MPHAFIFGQSLEYINEKDLLSKLSTLGVSWYTYRRNLIGVEKYTRDTGWGCTLRSTQMFISHLLFLENVPSNSIVQYLLDLPNSPFGLQSFLSENEKNKQPGTWWGPFECITTFDNIIKQHRLKIPKTRLSLISTLLCDSSTIYLDDIYQELNNNGVESNHFVVPPEWNDVEMSSSLERGNEESIDDISNEGDEISHSSNPKWTSSVNIFLPLRLGVGQCIDVEQFGEQVSNLFQLPFFLGAIGGKPNHSLFLIGLKEGKSASFTGTFSSTSSFSSMDVIGVDPHIEQTMPTLNDEEEYNAYLESLKVKKVHSIKMAKLDSSLVVGLRVASDDDVKALWKSVKSGRYPIQVAKKRNLRISVREVPSSIDSIPSLDGVSDSDWDVV
jgi:Peptidase family C54